MKTLLEPTMVQIHQKLVNQLLDWEMKYVRKFCIYSILAVQSNSHNVPCSSQISQEKMSSNSKLH